MKKLCNKAVAIISVFLVISGIILISYDYIAGKKELAYDKVSISLYSDINGEVVDNTPQEIAESEVETTVSEGEDGTYLGILKIDKIGLEQGFYDKDNQYNNIKYNVTLLDVSNYPDEKNGNTILIAHSGSSHIGYFKNLYQLANGDIAAVVYKGKTYIYKIVSIYTDTKDGDVTIYRNKNKTTLTLITCTKNDETTQTIYIAELQ